MVTFLATWGHPSSKPPPNSSFWIAFHIFVVGEHRNFKFGVQVDHSKFQACRLWDTNSLKDAWSHHVTLFKFLVPKMFLERLKLETSNLVH